MGLVVHSGQAPELLSKKLESVDEDEVLVRWFNIQQVPCVISSPFRDDKTPSFSIRYNRQGHIKAHDFATGENFSVVDMVMKAEKTDFKTAASMILNGKFGDFTRDSTLAKPRPAKPSQIEIVERQLNDDDIKFWKSFGITPEWLEFGHIVPVSDFVFKSDSYTKEMAAEKYAYAYITQFGGRIHTKIYQPFSKKRKWLNDGDGITQVWNLLDRLPEKGEAVIITSSLKDALCIWATTGVPSCCPQSESANLDKDIVEDLKKKFKRVLVLFDNDFGNPRNPGQTGAMKNCEKFGLENIVIESWYECKDPSDLYKRYGAGPLRKMFQKLNLCTEDITERTGK